MHPKHHLLLDAVAYLQPSSVHEVSCGGGDHMSNITRLFPDCAASGRDRGLNQLEMAANRHPENTQQARPAGHNNAILGSLVSGRFNLQSGSDDA